MINKSFSHNFHCITEISSPLHYNNYSQYLFNWFVSSGYFSALETLLMCSTNLWYLLTYLLTYLDQGPRWAPVRIGAIRLYKLDVLLVTCVQSSERVTTFTSFNSSTSDTTSNGSRKLNNLTTYLYQLYVNIQLSLQYYGCTVPL